MGESRLANAHAGYTDGMCSFKEFYCWTESQEMQIGINVLEINGDVPERDDRTVS
jgi:hypothetical protein